ncbi:universal stress protein [soil metagenome]|nr:universal stress protein [Trueperaceae bacterium]
MFSRILVPTDFSGSADAALALARSHFPEAQRCLLHVVDPQRLASSAMSSVSAGDDRRALEAAVTAQLEELAIEGEGCAVRVGPAAETILEKARAWDADLIVMGTHGRTGIAHFLNGSVAEQVVRHARRPVLIEHERKE